MEGTDRQLLTYHRGWGDCRDYFWGLSSGGGTFRRQKGQSYHEAYCPMGAAAEGSPVGVKVAAAKPHPYLFASDILAVDEHLLLCPEVDIMSGPLQG